MVALSAIAAAAGCQDKDKKPKDDPAKGPPPAETQPTAVSSTARDLAIGGVSTTSGVFAGTTAGQIAYNSITVKASIPNGCSRWELIQVMHVIRMPGGEIVDPHFPTAYRDPNPLVSPPDPADASGGWVVDKHAPGPASPTYPGSTPGTPGTPASLDDRPEFLKPGHRAVFDVCALCVAAKTDPLYGKFGGCVRWYYDNPTDPNGREAATVGGSYPAPHPKFMDALARWKANHGEWRPPP